MHDAYSRFEHGFEGPRNAIDEFAIESPDRDDWYHARYHSTSKGPGQNCQFI
jgi:hypothetical protein